jgi:hypothetical protein
MITNIPQGGWSPSDHQGSVSVIFVLGSREGIQDEQSEKYKTEYQSDDASGTIFTHHGRY